MPKSSRNFLASTGLSLVTAALAGLMLVQCAPAFKRAPGHLFVGPSEPTLLRVQPFDSTLTAELHRGGIDPVSFEQEFNNELRYRFFLRKQEEAQDSVSAKVLLTVTVRHLQPGTGASGTFAVVAATVLRDGTTETTEWTLRKPAKDNVPPAYLARDLTRLAVEEVLKRIPPAKPKPKEPPPPLILL